MNRKRTNLRHAYLQSLDRSDPCALVIVTKTQGSTYARVGSRMLIGSSGWSLGIVGGGCFDQELITKGVECLKNNTSMDVYFDLRKPDDGLFGSGQGCEGLTQLWIGPITQLLSQYDIDRVLHPEFVQHPIDNELVLTVTGQSQLVFKERIHATKRLVIVGRGEDIIPLTHIADSLDWSVIIVDPRPVKDAVQAACARAKVYTQSLTDYFLSEASRSEDAVVLMSHDLSIDALSLEAAAGCKASYIGLLGPERRRERILEMIDPRKRSVLLDRLHAPCGKRLLSKEPAIIALAICNEIAESFRDISETEKNQYSSR